MTNPLFKFSSPYLDKRRKTHIPLVMVRGGTFPAWLKKQDKRIRNLCEQSGFKGQPEKAVAIRDSKSELQSVVIGVKNPCGIYDVAAGVSAIRQILGQDFIDSFSFYIEGDDFSDAELENAHIGWALACYNFDFYKKSPMTFPSLVWSKGVAKKRVTALAESAHFLRNIINAPANDMGPDELEDAARFIAKKFKAKIAVIKDAELLDKNFPMIYAVGHGSHRRPRLIDITWGDTKSPKITLIGKGVCFDTGGLNIKPGAAMALMKKDMGGAAHALTLGRLIMELNLPVRLRILVPAVENSIGGSAFRPGDILRSRKGLTVENTNTDAEGRLILADAITYACEENPKLLIDFATLTGSARAGLGPDIPPFFSTSEALAERLKRLSFRAEDPVWPMPLWKPYKKLIESPVADLVNSTSIPGDLIFSALFLEQFLTGSPDWIHLDIYAWEHTGRQGRPRGGADTGLRALLALIEDLVEDGYGKKEKRK